MLNHNRAKAIVKIDTDAGSRSYNRLDMQVSQSLHMAIELYDSFDYLLILDHYDDISVFDLSTEPFIVSYYQVKTSDNEITIDTAISENWLAKLYMQLSRPENWLVKEHGLITNVPLTVTFKNNGNGKAKSSKHKQKLSAERSAFLKLHSSVVDRIKADIASKCGIVIDEVDLSKFAHLRTTLTIERHKDLVEKEMEDFLYGKYPRIQVDTVKGIFSALVEVLTRKQSYERLPYDAAFEDVKKFKGISRSDVTRVIDKAILLSIPTFDDVLKFSQVEPDMKEKLSFPYVQILTDSMKKGNESFHKLFNETVEIIKQQPFGTNETVWEYGQRIGKLVYKKEPLLCIPYNQDYIAVLTVCIFINKTRRLP